MLKNRITFCLIVCLCINFLFQSCNENKPHEFSHDEDVNQWIIDNKSKIINYDRDDIKKYGIEKQKAMLNLLPSESKKKIWMKKMDYVLGLNLSIEELNYLKWFKNKLEKIDYDKPDANNLDDELYEKVVKGMEKFGWNKKFVFEVFFVVGNVDVIHRYTHNDPEISTNSSFVGVDEDGKPDCNCKYDVGCFWLTQQCKRPEVGCEPTYNCGVLGTAECKGVCRYI